jgi:hypothetical protein
MKRKVKTPVGSLRNSIPVGTSFTPLKTLSQVDEEFRKSATKANDGANNLLRDCMSIFNYLTSGVSRTFTLTEYLRRANALGLPLAESKRIFERYVSYLILHNKLESMETIYDETCYLILN